MNGNQQNMSISEIKQLRFHAEQVVRLCIQLENQHEGLKSGQLSAPKKKKLTDEQKLILINKRKLKRPQKS